MNASTLDLVCLAISSSDEFPAVRLSQLGGWEKKHQDFCRFLNINPCIEIRGSIPRRWGWAVEGTDDGWLFTRWGASRGHGSA